MNRDATRARAMLDAWHASGADRLDPVRFHRIDALERRAAGHDGDARRLLDARLEALLAGYAGDVERAGAQADDANEPGDVAQARPASGALAGLVTHLARDAQADRAGIDPALIDYFRETWSKVRTEKQYRQALDQVPRNAGPLNSSSLVHRSLSLMRDLSPGYLQQFLSYVDALAWLEDLTGGGAQAEKEAPRAKGVKKGARSKAR
ncbi:DUF2894 domain-containing protein [Burkholderia ubonensis]|uniref:DUF2894 domain-containing protein n=1 Tax=Burkholderia ubonensis TaxID=101571 RepID=UPI000BA59FC4|nr:DUF2894 domain-containing protein [Burkholderia ubonensis]PAK14324.1 hypothetical protein CJO66_12570 [Burkholderia ubonensis]RQP38584.1 DUF2894 domain-containing protein [Burkholderia ubonensis]RQP39595.1 DUF2894 domain-containing protein [Burkholderia ubonensis]RQP39894.1 DUF2894 domain-containing protein [Burkholderia ubonensis]RQP52936.1 DUF2894 domain-containing protein [Burkholderia ubonensis]